MCRRCFFALAAQWREANRAEGLCACGLDPLPGIGSCRECNARQRRQATARRNEAKARIKAAEERERLQELENEQRKLRKRLTLEECEAAITAHDGDKKAAALSLGMVQVGRASVLNLFARRLTALRKR